MKMRKLTPDKFAGAIGPWRAVAGAGGVECVGIQAGAGHSATLSCAAAMTTGTVVGFYLNSLNLSEKNMKISIGKANLF